MRKGFTLIELLIATLISLFIALALAYLFDTSFRVFKLYKKKVDEKKMSYFLYVVQRQLIGCHNLEFKEDGIWYLTSSGLTEGFVMVRVDATKEGIIYEEYKPETKKLLYSYRIPSDSTFSYDGRRAVKFSINGKDYILFTFCSEEIFTFIIK